MTIQNYKVDETDSEVRIDTYLANMYETLSRTKIQAFIKTGNVLVNNKPCKSSYVVHTDDEVFCDFPQENSIKIEPENIPLDIVFEDEYFAIINKPSGMLTHPTSNEKTGTLVNALLYKYGDNLSSINGEYRRGIVHRLDRNTSGILIVPKTDEAHIKIAGMIKNREVEKRYRAIVRGRIDKDIVINEPIGRNKTHPNKMCVSPDGKESVTEVNIIEQFAEATYVDINLKTGRTHQIRTHLSYIGHPVFNDTMYGFGKMKIKTEEQVLQSYMLKFNHPFNNSIVDVRIESDEKINKVLNYLDK